jgi:hypothetical protein
VDVFVAHVLDTADTDVNPKAATAKLFNMFEDNLQVKECHFQEDIVFINNKVRGMS